MAPGLFFLHHRVHHLRHYVLQRDALRTFGSRLGFRFIQRLWLRIPSGSLLRRFWLRRRRRVYSLGLPLCRRSDKRRLLFFRCRFFLPGVDRFQTVSFIDPHFVALRFRQVL